MYNWCKMVHYTIRVVCTYALVFRGGTGPFSKMCDWSFLKYAICEKAKFNFVICDRGIFCDL